VSRVSALLATVTSGGLLAGLLMGCGSADDGPSQVAKAAVSGEMVRSMWMVQVADPADLDALAGHPGWQAYHARDYVKALGIGGDWAGTGRVHAELSAIYRQAALLAARAIEQTYKPDQRREGDPQEVDYLVGVAHAVMGDLERAKGLIGQNSDSASTALAAADTAWAERLAAGEPVLALIEDTRLYPLGAPVVGTVPAPAPAPHYALAETIGDRMIKAADPTVLLQLAAWHEAAAITAAGAERTAALLAPWLLPGETPTTVDPSVVTLEDLFLSAYASADDLARAAAGGEGSSPYGSLIDACEGEAQVMAACTIDAAVNLRKQVMAAMESVAGGPSPNHRMMSAFAEAGALRAGVRTADTDGDRDAAGLLRIAAKDMSDEAAIEPVFMVSLAAWDVGNRNPLRAQELLHAQLRRVPGLDAARYALDALHLRVSRDSGPGMPMH
jgi:hypothetical protein